MVSQEKYLVHYIDYGNTQQLSPDNIARLPEQYASLPPQAREFQLLLTVPPQDVSSSSKYTSSACLREFDPKNRTTADLIELRPAHEGTRDSTATVSLLLLLFTYRMNGVKKHKENSSCKHSTNTCLFIYSLNNNNNSNNNSSSSSSSKLNSV